MLIVQMDWFALNLALPPIAEDFGVAPTDLQWIVSGYMLAIGALMVTAGRLADIYGRRKIIVIGLVVFGALSAVCGAAQDETWLIAARVVQGVGARRSSSPSRSRSPRARSPEPARAGRSASFWGSPPSGPPSSAACSPST